MYISIFTSPFPFHWIFRLSLLTKPVKKNCRLYTRQRLWPGEGLGEEGRCAAREEASPSSEQGRGGGTQHLGREGEKWHIGLAGQSLDKTEFRIMNFKPYSASGLEHFIVALTNYQKLNGSNSTYFFLTGQV